MSAPTDFLVILQQRAADDEPRITVARNGRRYTRSSLAAHILARIEVTQSGCWRWRLALSNGGYASLSVDHGRKALGHRVAYELLAGPIPDGLALDHICLNRGCVNPAHLEPVTIGENTRRGYAVPTRVAVRRREPCRSGHQRTPENVRVDPKSGKIHCRPCQREAQRRYAARKAVAA